MGAAESVTWATPVAQSRMPSCREAHRLRKIVARIPSDVHGDSPPAPADEQTDLTALDQGFVTLTSLQYDMTRRDVLNQMRDWNLRLQRIVR